ncbi:C-terminal helicase domain-containing protein [Yinghuangia sp. ASG 101]|nr:C-terminal helicase domain-containing protein [Yinghuangia sp. ASG 101]
MTGASNPAEAELCAELAAFHRRGGADWAAIVPYRAQVAVIIEKIAVGRLRDTDTVRHNVGAVDSFQGVERDVIPYGSTRGNNPGEVGFLRELCRINVALSRVRRQLVMVGDPTTLANLERGIAEAGLPTVGDLADFVTPDTALVEGPCGSSSASGTSRGPATAWP